MQTIENQHYFIINIDMYIQDIKDRCPMIAVFITNTCTLVNDQYLSSSIQHVTTEYHQPQFIRGGDGNLQKVLYRNPISTDVNDSLCIERRKFYPNSHVKLFHESFREVKKIYNIFTSFIHSPSPSLPLSLSPLSLSHTHIPPSPLSLTLSLPLLSLTRTSLPLLACSQLLQFDSELRSFKELHESPITFQPRYN